MSIDARVQTVIINEDGSGYLKLIDRPVKRGNLGIAGQAKLIFARAPEEVTALNGCDIWGGDSSIMLGDEKIGFREGWTGIRFVEPETFKAAVAAYRRHQKIPIVEEAGK